MLNLHHDAFPALQSTLLCVVFTLAGCHAEDQSPQSDASTAGSFVDAANSLLDGKESTWRSVDAAPKCVHGGCSDEKCVEGDDLASGGGTCEWRPEYACLQKALCARQVNGHCGPTPDKALIDCLWGQLLLLR